MKKGWVGWLGIALVVAGYELPAVRHGWGTMTEWRPRVTVPLMVYVVAHLAGVIPPRLDPLERLGVLLRPSGT